MRDIKILNNYSNNGFFTIEMDPKYIGSKLGVNIYSANGSMIASRIINYSENIKFNYNLRPAFYIVNIPTNGKKFNYKLIIR